MLRMAGMIRWLAVTGIQKVEGRYTSSARYVKGGRKGLWTVVAPSPSNLLSMLLVLTPVLLDRLILVMRPIFIQALFNIGQQLIDFALNLG